VGTPEPGGIGWYDLLRLLRAVFQQRRVVAVDVVELAPIPGLHAPDFLAARLVYKLIGYRFHEPSAVLSHQPSAVGG
jgi:agmatinase